MRSVIFLVRFFRVAPPLDPLMRVTWGVVGALAGVVLLRGGNAAALLTPIVLLQGVAASSAFAGAARRGHYDLPFIVCGSRVHTALAHWMASVVPGAMTWVTVAALETVLRQRFPVLSFAPGSVVAMLLISTVPWAVTAPWRRRTYGMVWMLLLVVTTTTFPIQRALLSEDGFGPVAAGTAAVLLCPWLLVGIDLALVGALRLSVLVGVAMAVMLGALAWIRRADLPLEIAQCSR